MLLIGIICQENKIIPGHNAGDNFYKNVENDSMYSMIPST